MSIWNKVLVGLICVMSLVFFFYALRALKTHQVWQYSYQEHQKALGRIAKEKLDLIDGTTGNPGIRAMTVALHKLTVDRGRVWPNTRHQFDPNSNAVTVVPTLPPPHLSKAADMQLFLFEEATEGKPGAYLGEFTIKSVGNEWRLQPTWVLNPERRTRLQQSQVPWVMYEIMPAAIPGFLPEDIKRPGEAPATPGSESDVAATPAEPSPRDAAKPQPAPAGVKYDVLFTEYYRQIAELRDMINAVTADVAALEDANGRAQKRTEDLKQEIAAVKVERDQAEAARVAVIAHRKAIESKLAEIRTAAEQTEKANRAAVAQITRIQLEATGRIEERTQRMAQAGGGN